MGALGKIAYLKDYLVNLVANLGTSRDKASAAYYQRSPLGDQQLTDAYRGNWLPAKVVDVPAEDATSEWRSWQASRLDVEMMEAEEERLKLKISVFEAQIKARLFGGCGIYISTGETNPMRPLDPASVTKGGIRRLTVLDRTVLKAGDIDKDPDSEFYGKPRFYMLGGERQTIDIHASRIVRFVGSEVPSFQLAAPDIYGWGDSVLAKVYGALTSSDSALANVLSLLYEAKVDIFQIPDLMQQLAQGDNSEFTRQLTERLQLAATLKGNNGTLILDAAEEYSQKTLTFGSMPDLLDRFFQVAAAAADIPMTRLFGRSPGGMNSTGESDMDNYHKGIRAIQSLRIGPAMTLLDECLIRSALGSRPKELNYVWNPLNIPTAKELSEIGKNQADTVEKISKTQLIPEIALARACVTMLTQSGVMPGLEAAVLEEGLAAGKEDEPDPDDEGNDDDPRSAVTDAKPRTLYVRRNVTNASEILAWAKAQGFTDLIEASDMHVTIAYSSTAIDWLKVSSAWGNTDGTLTVPPGGPRIVEPLGDKGAVVLLFANSELSWRHMAIREAGASWDYEEYTPHVTLTYVSQSVETVIPYRGKIELGPEIFEELNPLWKPKTS